MTRNIVLPFSITGSDAARARFPLRSRDPALLTRLTSDWCLDATVAVGHASGTLPADAAALGAGGLVNLANNSPLAIPAGLRGAVSCVANGAAPSFSNSGAGNRGINRNGEATSAGLRIAKVGIADVDVGHPPSEGFLDFLFLIWARPSALNYWSLAGCSNNNFGADMVKFWGITCNGGGAVQESLSGRGLAGLAAGTWAQIGSHYSYNTGSGAILVRSFINGGEVNAGLAATPVATTTAAMAAAISTATKSWIGSNGIDPCFKGLIGRAERILTGLPGNSLDPLALVVADFAVNRARIAGL